MKKIFAFVLASIMVLSLVPASAFAAITKDCPETHNLNNCEYTRVETVKPSCTSAGYTVYECNACGEQFLANFVELLEHSWKDNSNTSSRKNQTLDCKNKKDGIKYVKCKVCGLAEKQVTPWNQGHTPKYVTGFGCEALYECTKCGIEFYGLDKNNEPKPEAGHDWEFTKVEKEPVIKNGVVTPGSALYTCKGCKDTKSVEIVSPACKCDGFQDVYTTKIVNAVKPDCVNEGTWAVYKCNDCNQLWYYDSDEEEYEAIEKIEDAIRPALGHTPKDDKVTTKGCTDSFTCDRCKKAVVEYNHDENDPYVVVTKYSDVDCVNYGYSVYLCNYCGWSEAIFTEPTGHKLETVVVESTCASFGYVYTYCTNENCSVTQNATPNTPATPNVPTFTYIDRASGLSYAVGVDLDDDGDLDPVKVVSLQRTTVLNPNAHDVVLVSSQNVSCVQPGLLIYRCKFCNVMTYETIPATGHDFDKEKTEYKPADCIKPGYIREYCKNCNLYVETPIAATPGIHNYVLTYAAHHCTAETITNPSQIVNGVKYYGREIYACSGCGVQLNTIPVDPVTSTPVQVWFESLEEAEFWHFGSKELVGEELQYSTLAIHNNLVKQEDKCVAATCYTNGYDVYLCTKCNNLVYVTTAKADHTVYKTTKAKAATCKATGNIEYYTCYECNTMFIIKEDKQVTVTGADIIINKHASTLVKKTVKDCTGEVIHTYWQCSGKDCGKKFTDETASTTYTGPTKAVSHKYTTIVKYVPATCENDDVVGIYFCDACKTYKLEYDSITYSFGMDIENDTVSIVPISYNIEHHELEDLTLEEVEAKEFGNSDDKIEIYISAAGVRTANAVSNCKKFEHGYVDSNNIQNAKPGEWWLAVTTTHVGREDCSTPEYDHNFCAICEYEFIDNYKPASSADGHVNKYGDKIPTDCGALQALSKAKRTCFYCGEVVAPKHDLLDQEIVVEATCTDDGYVYDYCVDCGHRVVVEVNFADADAYHKDENNRVLVGVAADYANKGDSYYACDACGKQLTKTVKADAEKTGIEIVLSTDADSYVLGSTIYVTVALDSFYGANVWGLDFNVMYDPTTLEFLDKETEWVTKNFTEAHDAAQQLIREEYTDEDGKTTIVKVPSGEIKVAANAKENVNVKGSQDLVILAFKVIDPKATYAGFFVPVYEAVYDEFMGQEEFVEFVPAITVVDEKGKAVNCIYNEFVNDPYSVEFEEFYSWLYEGENLGELAVANLNPLLDVDGNGRGGNDLNMEDILALYELIVFGEYNVTADTDFNGIINMIDLANAYKVLVGRSTVEELAGVIPSDWIPADGAKN